MNRPITTQQTGSSPFFSSHQSFPRTCRLSQSSINETTRPTHKKHEGTLVFIPPLHYTKQQRWDLTSFTSLQQIHWEFLPFWARTAADRIVRTAYIVEQRLLSDNYCF